jgi:poly-gamma-glutamate synthesis protein (capsule biosynthesis protein)
MVACTPFNTPSASPTDASGATFLPTEPSDMTEVTAPSEPIAKPTEDIVLPGVEPEFPQTYTLTFVGDCTLGTMPEWKTYGGCFDKVIGSNYDLPFHNIRHYFESDDCTFINFEGVLADGGIPEEKRFTFIGPTDHVSILTGSSVEVANLANNHSYDFGIEGYQSTTKTLRDNGVTYIENAKTALYTTNSGLKIGMYGMSFSLNTDNMRKDVQLLKDAGADVIVAAVHWGIERDYIHNETQTSIAHKLIDAGVNIVWGHHPHVLQPIEIYNDGIIYYSTGNFSFGGNHNPFDKDTAIFQQTITKDLDGTITIGKLNVIPCRLSSVEEHNDFQPIPYNTDNPGFARVLQKLKWGISINDTQDAH